MTYMLNKPAVSWLLSALVGVVFCLYEPLRRIVAGLVSNQAFTLVGIVVSLLGFVIAALAIVTSLQNLGPLRLLKRNGGGLWKQLMAVFANSSKVLGLAAMLFFVVGMLNSMALGIWGERAIVFGCTFLCLAVIFQVAKVIHVLESIGSL